MLNKTLFLNWAISDWVDVGSIREWYEYVIWLCEIAITLLRRRWLADDEDAHNSITRRQSANRNLNGMNTN